VTVSTCTDKNKHTREFLCYMHARCVGLVRTIYIQCIHGILGREITKYTVIYGAYIRFWPTLTTCVRFSHKFSHPHTGELYDVCVTENLWMRFRASPSERGLT